LGELILVVLSNVAVLLLHVTNDLHLSGGSEGDALTLEEPLHPVGEDTTGDLHLFNGVRNGETFKDGDSVGDTITRIANETSRSAGGVEGHDSLESNIDVFSLEGLEHDRGHLFSVLLWVTGGLSKQNADSLSWVNTELVVEGVVPDLFHVLP
jgi:hypothetical protein